MKKILSTIFALALAFTSLGVNPVVRAEELADWTSPNGGSVTSVEENGVRYHKLSSTPENNNAEKSAEFVRNDIDWNIELGSGSATLEFVTVKDAKDTRFGLNLLHSDMENYLTVGYDASGWFWQWKLDGDEDYKTDARIAGPKAGETVKLDVQFDNDTIFANVVITDEEGTVSEPVEVVRTSIPTDKLNKLKELSADRNNVVVRLGHWTPMASEILVKDSNQEGVTPPEVDEPELGPYEEYTKSYDFNDIEEAQLAEIFNKNNANIKTTLVEHEESQAVKVDFTTGRNLLTFAEVPKLDNFEIEGTMTPQQAVIRLGLTGRVKGDSLVYSSVGDANAAYYSEHYGPGAYSGNSSGPAIKANESHVWKLRVVDSTVTLWVDDQKILENTMNSMPLAAGEVGFFKDRGVASVIIDDVTITRIPAPEPSTPDETGTDIHTLTTPEMEARVDKAFPRVIDYTLNGKTITGNQTKIDTVKINGHDIIPEVLQVQPKDTEIEYVLRVKDDKVSVNVDLTAKLSIDKNILTFEITNVNNKLDGKSNATIVRTIEIPNHSLVSVTSEDTNSNVYGARMSTNTTAKGDTLTKVTDKLTRFSAAYMYAVVSNSELSASLYSNSQTSKSGDFNRIAVDATEYKEFNAVGLSSSEFIYQRDVMFDIDKVRINDDLPFVQVVITEDANDDGVIDWNDGAIAARDIVYLPLGSEGVKDLVAYRIAMNFGSHAQNPFLMTLDYIKKVNLHTDGLGQSILHKGYGSEGHDSGHLDYADVGRRIGGAPEFKELLRQSKDYGAKVGIHVNASETYPESKYFTEELLRRNGDDYNYGWNWIDQGINIDAAYDLANGRRERWVDLYDVLGGEENDLDWIYVDVWGNGQSGDNGSWASHQLAKEINDLGWRLGGEWGYAFQPDTTFSHWATDLTYGGYGLKGINSDLARFILNSKRDTWDAHYPSYSGAADYPLLEGYNMKDFEGWQGRNDYDGYMLNLFENNVPTKFIQHFEPMKWELGKTVTMNNSNVGNFQYTPEKRVTLEGDLGTLVIERKSEDYSDLNNFRGKNMYLNGKLVQTTNVGNLAKADIQYLLPWFWDHDGKNLPETEQKLYHFNKQGGESTWELPEEWIDSNANVVVYQLTETGRKLVDTVDVVNGKVTLTAEVNTAYTVYQGEQKAIEVTYGDGSHLDDPSFNNQNLDVWTVEGEGAQVEKSQATNDMLSIRDNKEETKVSQILHDDLEPGKDYVAYVGVDNRADAAARLTIKVDGEEYSNYTNKSIAKNYVKAYGHNTNSSTINNNSYFQNLFVYFTAPAAGKKVELILSRDAGDGVAFFDDVRVTRNDGNPIQADGSYFQDFEESAQGIAPFVVGNIENVEDNRTHLSELNAPYTQRGWNDKKISDVIEGNWSLKTNGLTQRNRLVYQTIPQNVRFEPGVEYTVSFDYELGSEGTYAVVVGDGEVTGQEVKHPLKATLNEEGALTYTTNIVGAESGQTWFGIWSTTVRADLGDSTDKTANFRSYKDIMLDNVSVKEYVEVEEVNKDALEAALEDALEYDLSKYTYASGKALTIAYEEAQAVLADVDATQAEVDAATAALEAAIAELVLLEGGEVALDVTVLEAALDIARQIDLTNYTTDTSDVLVAAIEAGELLITDLHGLTQTEINEAAIAIIEAIAGLELLEGVVEVDTTLLEKALELAETYDLELYTEESSSVLEAAIAAAKEGLSNPDITQAEVNELTTAILDAIIGLELVEEDNTDIPLTPLEPSKPITPEKPVDPEKPDSGNKPGTGDKDKLPPTGISSNTAIWTGIVVAGLALIVFLAKRKREEI